MKREICLILGFVACLSFNNCSGSGASDSSSNSAAGGPSTIASVVANVANLDSLTLNYIPQPSGMATVPLGSSVTYNHSTETLSLFALGTSTVTKTCTLPAATLTQLDDFWARAQICESKLLKPPMPPVLCPAIAAILPWATFSGPANLYYSVLQTSPATAGACNSPLYYICDTADLADLMAIGTSIANQLATLTCK